MFGRAIYRRVSFSKTSSSPASVRPYLPRHSDLFTVLKTRRALASIRIVEYNRNAGFGNSSSTSFVDEVLLVLTSELWRARDKHERCRLATYIGSKLTFDMSVSPSTKQMASRMLDLPEPLRPVMALNEESHPVICVRTGYDLKPFELSQYTQYPEVLGLIAYLLGRAPRCASSVGE